MDRRGVFWICFYLLVVDGFCEKGGVFIWRNIVYVLGNDFIFIYKWLLLIEFNGVY